MLYRDTAIVLRTYKLGEADRIVVLFTRGRGKVRAVAKGVRKTRSKFGARMEPTSHVNLQLHAGRDLHTVTQAETVETFPNIRSDLDRLGRAAAILEVVDQVATEAEEHGEEHESLYQLLLGGLRAIENRPSPLVAPAFFLKLLASEGVGFSVDGCIECGRDDEMVSLDLEGGGLRCSLHREGTAITPGAVGLLRGILGGQLAWALDQPTSPATWEVDHLAQVAIENHIARRLRALRLISAE
ncbi:MAG TPA: DNA repair protein RecO [Microthrixaceae bacterium]|nr:DNA repair protein RecO [Microthrixaceae bacterium]